MDTAVDRENRQMLERIAPALLATSPRFAEVAAALGYAVGDDALLSERDVLQLLVVAQVAISHDKAVFAKAEEAFPETGRIPYPLAKVEPRPEPGGYFAPPAEAAWIDAVWIHEVERRRLGKEPEPRKPNEDEELLMAKAGLGVLGRVVYVSNVHEYVKAKQNRGAGTVFSPEEEP